MSFCACAEAKNSVFSLFPTQPSIAVAEEGGATAEHLLVSQKSTENPAKRFFVEEEVRRSE
jgi:hypothetical protein